jgi:two-component system NtrC family sensor kinase
MSALIGRLKDFVRLDQADQQRTSPSLLLAETVDMLRPQIPERIVVELDLGELPQIQCYPRELNQAFMTLIVNAVDAIEDTGRIVISSLIAGDEIRVRITDAGKGLQPERLSRIFEVGFVERGATMRMNVGLAMCQSLVHRHAGSIEVQSAVGVGTTFELILPIR